jgi:hypothetical protein
MSKRTIAKFVAIVISFAFGVSGCGNVAQGVLTKQRSPDYEPPKVIGRLANGDITESSGLVASKCQPGVFWTHNDSGDDAFIFAFSLAGENLGTWRVQNARNDDWEDIAAFKDESGKCFIYIGEIGNNSRDRDSRTVYRVGEPQVSTDSRNSRRGNALPTGPAEALRYTSQGNRQDAETLLVHPASGDIYILTKSREQPSSVFKLKPVFGEQEVQTAQKVAEIKVPSIPFGLLTGGDISPDGRRVVLCDYSNGYELTLPAGTASFEAIWQQPAVVIDLGDRETGESVTYSASGDAILATMEKKGSPIILVSRKR